MATFTTNYNLRKPAGGDLVNVSADIGANMDAIDTQMKSSADRLTVVENAGYVRKGSDETVNGSGTFQDDDDLSISTTAGKLYVVSAHLRYQSNATADIKFRWSFTGSGTLQVIGIGPSAAAVADPDFFSDFTATSPTQAFPYGGNSTNLSTVQHLNFNCTGSGTLKLQWCQGTSDASNTILRTGSLLEWRAY